MKIPLMIAMAGLLPASSLFAAFTLVNDFESYPPATNGTSAGWVQGFPTGGVGASTTSAVNASALATGQGLAFTYGGAGGQINYNTGTTIALEGATGTVFFQVGWAATGSDILFSFGRSTVAAYGDLAVLFRVPSDLILEVHNTAYANTTTTLANNTVYNFWAVINNTANTWDLHYSTGAGGPTLIQAGMVFRNTTAGDINTFYVGTNSGSTPVIDSIYVDSTGSNLLNPIPEPSVSLLAVISASLLAKRRKR